MRKVFTLIFTLIISFATSAQTIGINEVVSIESKSALFLKNVKQIERLKGELPGLEALRLEKIKKLNGEMAALIKERDALIADMKVGARCSQCQGWKSDFEKRGENFEKHLGDVKGYAIPATTSELEATRKEFGEKIAIKKVQIKNLEKGDNAILKKKEEIKTLEQKNEEICKDITILSKTYETKVYGDAEAKHENWMNQLMGNVTELLVATDKIDIYQARVLRYEQEFLDESEKVKERVKNENEKEQSIKSDKTSANKAQIDKLLQAEIDYLRPLEKELNEKQNKKREIDSEVKEVNISDSLRNSLILMQKELGEQIAIIKKEIKEYKESVLAKVSALENSNKILSDEIFALKTTLTKEQEKAIAQIKPLYDQKIADAQQSQAKSTADLVSAKANYSEREQYFTKQNTSFHNEVTSESNRMLIAGQSIGCSVWNDTRGMVMNNWNKVLPCVKSLTSLAKPHSSNVFNSYCGGQSSKSYMSGYRSFLSSLSPEDKEVVKANTNSSWYELMTN